VRLGDSRDGHRSFIKALPLEQRPNPLYGGACGVVLVAAGKRDVDATTTRKLGSTATEPSPYRRMDYDGSGPLNISASDSSPIAMRQAGIGESVKLVPPGPVLEPLPLIRNSHREKISDGTAAAREKLVLESESRNLHDPSASTALCVCAVKQRKGTTSSSSTPILLHSSASL
jgi:hypothetical protein